MQSERWQRVEELFIQALERPAETRAGFLASACPDVVLRNDVALLLAAADDSGDFLSTPALEVLAREVSRDGWRVRPGQRIGSYRVGRRLGMGGMGEVWRARDERLERDVAIKLLLPHPFSAPERVQAFHREARTAGALNHPNVLTVYDVGEHEAGPFLVTECLEGEPLRARLGAGPLPLDAALDIAVQAARGLEAAHQRGIVHRDLKPENIFLTTDGRVKIIDFGLATLHDAETPRADPDRALDRLPVVAGTAGYMAPEQIRGEAVDHRADIFALGAIMYEMLSGIRAIRTAPVRSAPGAIRVLQPLPLCDVNREVSPALAWLVGRCLAEAPADRYATTRELVASLEALVREHAEPAQRVRSLVRRPLLLAAIVALITSLAAVVWQGRIAAARIEWARTVAAPEIGRLATQGQMVDAFLLARQALDVLPEDPQIRQLWLNVSMTVNVTTEPAGADVSFTSYRAPGSGWVPVGRTPLTSVRLPRSLVRVRIEKPGFATIEGSASPPVARYRLDPVAEVPAGMVRVPESHGEVGAGLSANVDAYWMDRVEVTNREFQAFVDQGGYERREYWREPFVENGRGLQWEEAIARFRDTTGRPGPATWVSGTYPDGQAQFPVGGVSWYEAAAYAVFAGKNLPTIFHWYRAADMGRFADILAVSNFGGAGPAAASHRGIGPFGTFDMAGNVKEWCSTDTRGQRFLLGGAWNEPRYMYGNHDARPPFDREPAYGFRLVKYEKPLPPALAAPVHLDALDPRGRQRPPVSDDIFAVYRRQFAYDPTPLNAVVEETEETPLWVRHIVAFDAAYGGERMRLSLFLPKNAAGPFQTVVFFPPGDAFVLASSRDMSLAWTELIVRSGRAFLYPIYKGTYERRTPDGAGPMSERELMIAFSRDLGRALDYLGTRPDLDAARVAYFGVSAGADAGVILTALEPRLKASVLQGTGLWNEPTPELDIANYAPRVRVPTLMLSGRYDFARPFETAQRPLFALLGPPAGRKHHAVLEAGHVLPSQAVAHEILPWLDRYLGPVKRSVAR